LAGKLFVSWSRLGKSVFVAVCGAWAVYRDCAFFPLVYSGDRQIVDNEEMFAACDKCLA